MLSGDLAYIIVKQNKQKKGPSRVLQKGEIYFRLFVFWGIMFYTYILYSTSYDRYYVGHCEDLKKRLHRHNNKLVSSTKRFTPWIIVYYETSITRLDTSRRELAIKKMKSRIYIESLIAKKSDN